MTQPQQKCPHGYAEKKRRATDNPSMNTTIETQDSLSLDMLSQLHGTTPKADAELKRNLSKSLRARNCEKIGIR